MSITLTSGCQVREKSPMVERRLGTVCVHFETNHIFPISNFLSRQVAKRMALLMQNVKPTILNVAQKLF